MKYVALFFLLNFLLSAGCKKQQEGPDGDYFGNGSVLQNGIPVHYNKLSAGYIGLSADTGFIHLEHWDGLVLKRSLNFVSFRLSDRNPQRIHLYAQGTTRLYSNGHTLRDDGDVLCDTYRIYEPDSVRNFMIIQSFDEQTKEIKGVFEATYVRDTSRSKCRVADPDTLIVQQGLFHTKIFP